MAKWVGYAVSVNCGEPLGCYQGTILEADGTTITLTKAFRNGFPYPKSQVTLNAADIKDLKIIESKPEPAEQTHSTVAVTKSHKKGQKATVCENLQANPTNSDSVSSQNVNPASTNKGSSTRGSGPGPARSKPIDIQNNRNQNKNNSYTGSGSGSYGGAGGAGGARGAGADKARRRNEACFGSAAEVALDDFDFEGNLALFDKRALWERMRLEARPDVVRAAERLRPDQSVLPAPPPAPPPAPHAAAAPPYYRADHGARLPSLRPDARRQLYLQLERLGLGQCARTLVARAAADVSLRLVGGSRRLEAANAHQAPLVLALVGAHAAGAAGARCLRLLAAHGARAALHVAGADGADGAGGCAELRTELAALQLDGVRPQPLAALPEPDLLLLALDDPAADPRDPPPDYQAAVRWAGGCRGGRAVCVCLEGGRAAGALRAAGGRLRAAVLGALPAAEGAPAAARLYLAPVAAPRALLHRLGLPPPPQAAAHPLPLYPADDHHDTDTDRDTDAVAAH